MGGHHAPEPSLDLRHCLQVKQLGLTDYNPVFARMQNFTEQRTDSDADELWFTEHNPVFTQGQAGKAEHVLLPGDIPVVQTDRGGQVTYHGPGQITVYFMCNLRRRGMGVRDLVTSIENSMIDTLAGYDIEAAARPDAPGVYVQGRKIGSLGLRVRKGCSYHGLSLNVDMDLEPFSRINPCGLMNMQMTQVTDFTSVTVAEVSQRLHQAIEQRFGVHSL